MRKMICLVCIILFSGCATTEGIYGGYYSGYHILKTIEDTSARNAIMYNQMYWNQQQQLNQTIESNRIMHQNQWNNDVNRWNNGFNK